DGLKQSAAAMLQKISLTSGPTSKASGPIAGPSQTGSSSGGTCMAATAFSRMPEASPRHPAWAAATRVPARSQNRTGGQSAVITAQATPGSVVQLASASSTRPGAASTTSVL